MHLSQAAKSGSPAVATCASDTGTTALLVSAEHPSPPPLAGTSAVATTALASAAAAVGSGSSSRVASESQDVSGPQLPAAHLHGMPVGMTPAAPSLLARRRSTPQTSTGAALSSPTPSALSEEGDKPATPAAVFNAQLEQSSSTSESADHDACPWPQAEHSSNASSAASGSPIARVYGSSVRGKPQAVRAHGSSTGAPPASNAATKRRRDNSGRRL